MEVDQRKKIWKSFGRIFGRCMLILAETVLLAVIALYCGLFVLAKGPSPAARDLFVLSVRETSAAGFLADLFFTEEEIAAIEQGGEEEILEDTDTSLIVIPDDTKPDTQQGPVADAWGLVDEDNDGIIIEPVKGEGYTGYMMVVLDPSRVVMGCSPEDFGIRGYTVAQMAEKYDAIAGINAGGFWDEGGKGNGNAPDSAIVYQGKIYYAENGMGIKNGFVGIDDKHIMHVGTLSLQDLKDKNIQYGVGFGPVLVSNGMPVTSNNSGVNPRTAIGQRSDGAMLLLVIDGRQATSLGVTYQELSEIFLSYGAVNACNLDGGSSSLMWYEGEYINNCASLLGIRPVPTTFLVLKKGE